MHIVTRRHLAEVIAQYPDAADEIMAWASVVEAVRWRSFLEVETSFRMRMLSMATSSSTSGGIATGSSRSCITQDPTPADISTSGRFLRTSSTITAAIGTGGLEVDEYSAGKSG